MEYRAVVILKEEIHLKIEASTEKEAEKKARSFGICVDDLMFRSKCNTKATSIYSVEIGDFADIEFSEFRI